MHVVLESWPIFWRWCLGWFAGVCVSPNFAISIPNET